MPTNKRKARERKLAAERAAWDRQFSVETPEHALSKMNSLSNLRDALSIAGTAYVWGGMRYFDVNGKPCKPHLTAMPEDLGANVERRDAALLTAQELRRKYADLWHVRGGAKQIAAAEGIALSTVYAHMKRLRMPK